MPNPRSAVIASLLSGLIVCTAIPPARAAKPDFNGAWSVKWCDNTAPDADCGGFHLYLVQAGEKLCGSFFGARVRLSQIDEGDSRSVLGMAVGSTAVLTIRSGRTNAIYLAKAEHKGGNLEWRVTETIDANRTGDIDIVASDARLVRNESVEAVDYLGRVRGECWQEQHSGVGEEQARNAAVRALAEYCCRYTHLREPQEIAVYSDHLSTSNFSSAPGRGPTIYTSLKLDDAANIPATERGAADAGKTAITRARERWG